MTSGDTGKEVDGKRPMLRGVLIVREEVSSYEGGDPPMKCPHLKEVSSYEGGVPIEIYRCEIGVLI